MYKVDDKIRMKTREQLKKDWVSHRDGTLWSSKNGCSVKINSNMINYCGRVMTIDSRWDCNDGITRYNCKEDDGDWVWTDKMFTENDVTDKVFDILRGV